MRWIVFFHACLCLVAVRAKFDQSKKYVIETYFVLDKQAFANYVREQPATALMDAIKDMNFFLTLANERLATLKKFNLDIQFNILKTERLTTDIFQANGDKENNPKDILNAFNSWLETTQAKEQIGFDFAVYFTGHKMSYFNNGAQEGSICQFNQKTPQYPIAVVPFDGTAFCVNALLKHIGTAIGAGNDGSGSYNIMRIPNMPAHSADEYSFSECSAYDIKEFFTARDVNCLLESTSSIKGTVPSSGVDFYQGRAIDPDVLCARKSHPNSVACRYPHLYGGSAKLAGDAVCQDLYCTSEKDYKMCDPAWPSDGMWCNPNKLCKNGKCVDAMFGRIKDILEDCAFGDFKAPINDMGETCTDKLAEGSDMCYKYGYKCCETCAKYKTSYPNCEWGNKAIVVDNVPSTCAKYLGQYGMNRCTNPPVASICCQSCGDWKAQQRGKRDLEPEDVNYITPAPGKVVYADEVNEDEIGKIMESTLTFVDPDGQIVSSPKIFKDRQILENVEPDDVEV